MKMNRKIFVADLLALEELAANLHANARFHMDEVRSCPVGSQDRNICMGLAVYYQNEAKRISDGVLWRRIALVEGNTI